MLTLLAGNLVVLDEKVEYSQAVSMADANAASVSISVLEVDGAAQLDVYIEQSNDLENWFQLPSFNIRTLTVGFQQDSGTEIAEDYIRLRYDVTGGNSVVLRATVNTAKL